MMIDRCFKALIQEHILARIDAYSGESQVS